jgi:glycosyltransferase involved in cell wall biosynthesis
MLLIAGTPHIRQVVLGRTKVQQPMGPDVLVTVLMPCRDAHPRFLGLALRSVLEQSSPRWRLLVIDDASERADTLGVLRRLECSGDPRVRVVPSGSRYVTGALNTGMRTATTPYVCMLHCDDLLGGDAIATLNEVIEDDPRVDYFYSARRFIDEHGRALSGIQKAPERISPEDFVKTCPVKGLHCWRVEAALAIGGMDETLGLHAGDDYDFPWRMAEAGFRFKPIRDCLYLYRDHREHERLTTHVPLDVQIAHLRAMFAKHGLDETSIREQISSRQDDYLRQALFETSDDRRTKEAAGFDPRTGWRASYS